MIDLRLVRSDPDAVRTALERRGDAALLDPVLALDTERRALQVQVDELRAERNRASEAIGALKKAAKDDPAAAAQAEAASAEMRTLKEGLDGLEESLRSIDERLNEALMVVPNLPHPESPLGDTDEDARELRVVGEIPSFDFEPRDHLELAGGGIDMERGARTSGSRFGYLTGDIARLWWAISRMALDTLSDGGFTPVVPPVMVREEAMFATGFFPTDRQSVYQLSDDDLFMVGTSEVPLAAFHAGEILAEADLPLRYAGLSSCFRREAGAAGRDTRGIFRLHQFEKVEMFSFCHPDRSWDEHLHLLSIEESIAQTLGLTYRVVDIAAGDRGAAAARKYDIEVWLPGQQRFRELTSCSNCTDYQARRLDTRFKGDKGGPQTVHTLNGTAVTSSRTVIAVLEQHQQADGTVLVPQPLLHYGAPAVIDPRA
ncbi:MAG: serine--tRNA ligase [Gaiellales bacterium]